MKAAVFGMFNPQPDGSRETGVSAIPRLGFLGTGWIGRLRMQALYGAQCASFTAVHDPCADSARAAADIAGDSVICESIEQLLESDVDGVVIATPSAMHAKQCIQALRSGKAVFCQKPLARTLPETEDVIQTARTVNRLLGVDFSYRYLAGMETVRNLINSGELGDIYAADLVFHNAYGPDRAWFYDVKSAGGGCVIDLGIHLVDLAIWLLQKQEVYGVASQLFRKGQRMSRPYTEVEDYATASFHAGDTAVRLSCSWNLHAGRDAVIEANFLGTRGGAALRNVNGSFYDFEIFRCHGTRQHKIAGYPDAWGGRALTRWARQLSGSGTFDPKVEQVVAVADVIDRIYGR